MTPTLRPAVPADVPTLIELIQALAEYERLRHECHATAAQLHEHLFGAHPVAEVTVAEMAGVGIVGFTLSFTSYSTFLTQPGLYLEDLFVRPEHRGGGIGERLLRNLARIAVERGYGRLEWSVLDWNEPALRFYRRMGAVPMDEWTVQRVTGPALLALAADPNREPTS